MHSRRILYLAAAALLVLPLPALAQGFEGVIRQRSIELGDEALYDLIYANTEDEPEFDSETDWFRYVAANLFRVPLDGLADEEAEASDLTIHISGSKLRYEEVDGGGGYVVVDLATMTTRMVDPSSRSYVEFKAEDAQAAADEAAKAAEEMMARMGIDPEELAADYEEDPYEDEEEGIRFSPRVRALDRTETINGFTATAHEAEAGSELGIGWCVEDADGIRQALERMADRVEAFGEEEEEPGGEGPIVEDLICERGLPVRTQILRSDGWGGLSYSVTEVLSVEQTPLSEDVFEIPAGFTKKSFADMWR